MKIAVLSGKGGTGKTLVSVNLAAVARDIEYLRDIQYLRDSCNLRDSEKSVYIDCDVEEPNGHLFFRPEIIRVEDISVPIPEVDHALCDGCRKCVEFCNFNALAYIGDRLMVFDDICHSCGGCILVCPQKALTEKGKSIGSVEIGISGDVEVRTGILNIGEATGIPIIKRLLGDLDDTGTYIVDCPPGSACIVMESIKDADYCLLVAEPTLFGVHNLAMVYELVKLFGKQYGVVLNKCQNGVNPAEKFCTENGIDIVGRIPFESDLGMLNSNAEIAAVSDEKYRSIFTGILSTVREKVACKEVENEATVDS